MIGEPGSRGVPIATVGTFFFLNKILIRLLYSLPGSYYGLVFDFIILIFILQLIYDNVS